MSVFTSRDAARKRAKAGIDLNPANGYPGFMGFLDQVAQGTDYVLTHPLTSIANAFGVFAGLVTGNGQATENAGLRFLGWNNNNVGAATQAWVKRLINQVLWNLTDEVNQLQHMFGIQLQWLQQQLTKELHAERTARIRGDDQLGHYVRQRVAALHSQVEHEAASAYRAGFTGRLALISRILDYLGEHNTAVRGITRDIISGLLDLAAIDDPLVRLTATFLLRRVIGRLGVDRLAGDAVSALLAPLMGDRRPTGLPGVISDVSARLNALEQQWGTFWQNGGSEVEQAGQEWADITSPLTDVALLAWIGEAAADPAAWARQLSDVFGPAMTAAADAAKAAIRKA